MNYENSCVLQVAGCQMITDSLTSEFRCQIKNEK